MPLDLTNPRIINFLVENYEKTALLRMRWNELNASKLRETATFRGPEKGHTETDVAKSVIETGMIAATRDNIASAYNRRHIPPAYFIPGVAHLRKGHSIPEVDLGDPKDDPRLGRPDTDLSPDPVMRPVPQEQAQIIYAGLPNFGRAEYIKLRDHIKPEDKYYFKESMGWSYGWRLKDSYFGRHAAPSYGRTAKASKDKSRSGPQPDPVHYGNPFNDSGKCPPL